MTDQELAEEFLRRFADGDHEGLYELQSGVDWKVFPGPAEAVVPWFGHFRGRAEAERCMAEFARTVEVLSFTVEGFLSGDARVAAIVEARYRVRRSGKKFVMRFVNVIELRGGKIVSLYEYGDTADAVRAFTQGSTR